MGSGLIGRRDLLKLAAGVAVAPALLPFVRPAKAFDLGGVSLTVVSDGNLILPMAFAYPDAPQDALMALLQASGQPTDALVPDCNVPFVKSGDRLICFDVGSGSGFMPSAGKLLANMEAAGIDPGDVTDVVFTHAHPDHLWGLVDDFDELVFPNATHHMSQIEWDYWLADDTLDKTPEERKTFVVGAQNRLNVLDGQMNLFGWGDEVVPGVEAIDSSGHTPGHTSFMVHGGSEPVVILGDAISNAAVSFAQPAWPSGSDQDAEQGIKTRVALLDRLAADKAAVVGFHLPMPGEGRVERDGTAYRFVAAS